MSDGHGRPRGALRGGTGRGTVARGPLWAAMVVGDDRAASREADGWDGRAGPGRPNPAMGDGRTAPCGPGR